MPMSSSIFQGYFHTSLFYNNGQQKSGDITHWLANQMHHVVIFGFAKQDLRRTFGQESLAEVAKGTTWSDFVLY